MPTAQLDLTNLPAWRSALREEVQWWRQHATTPKRRTRLEFAKQVIVLPEGPHEGSRWREKYQPFAGHMLRLMDGLPFRRYAITGCVQSGKTLNAIVIPCLWHLFERKETVVYGLPSMDMAKDKWREELLPVIEASPALRQHLPEGGAGSRGGTPTAIKFRTGVTLKFMSAHGRDDKRSAFTAPVIVKTEVDRYDEAGESSRETDPAAQMDQRAGAFGEQAFIYEECTMTTENGRINQRFLAGTQTELYAECPECHQYVLPLREHLVGYEEAKTVSDAQVNSVFCCGKCGIEWTDEQRNTMLDHLTPVHRGELPMIGDDGSILYGDLPPVDGFSFRWNAFHNRFWSVQEIARREWISLYEQNPIDGDKESRQFRWSMPSEPDEFDVTPLTYEGLIGRNQALGRGLLPGGTQWISAGVDVRQTALHYVIIAWQASGIGHIVDLGIMDVDSESLGVRPAVLLALRELREKRWPSACRTSEGEYKTPQWTVVDGGWKTEVIRAFVRESGNTNPSPTGRWIMSFGRGQSEPPGKGSYQHPSALSDRIQHIGEDYYIKYDKGHDQPAIFANSDEWKTFVREGLAMPSDQSGALTIWEAVTADEKKLQRTYWREVLAERSLRKDVPRRGSVMIWVNDSRRQNHLGDATYGACVGGHLCGVRVATPALVEPTRKPLVMSSGKSNPSRW